MTMRMRHTIFRSMAQRSHEMPQVSGCTDKVCTRYANARNAAQPWHARHAWTSGSQRAWTRPAVAAALTRRVERPCGSASWLRCRNRSARSDPRAFPEWAPSPPSKRNGSNVTASGTTPKTPPADAVFVAAAALFVRPRATESLKRLARRNDVRHMAARLRSTECLQQLRLERRPRRRRCAFAHAHVYLLLARTD